MSTTRIRLPRPIALAISISVSPGCGDGAGPTGALATDSTGQIPTTATSTDSTGASPSTDDGVDPSSSGPDSGSDAGDTATGTSTGNDVQPEQCDTGADFIADYLDKHPLAPGEWSAAVDGMEGLNTWHDPDARTGFIRTNSKPIVGDTVTTGEHGFLVGDTVLIRGSSLAGQVRTIVSTTETTVTLDASADEPAEADVIIFPDYYTRSTPVEDESGGGCLDWNAQFYYDAKTGLHTVGGGVGTSASYIDSQYKTWRFRYDPCKNLWYKIWNPLGRGGGHHYASNAMDPAGRRYFRGTTMFDLDDDSIEGVAIPDTPDDSGTANTYCYHEGLDRLYRMTSHGRVRHWSDDDGWSERVEVSGMGNHPISAYLSGAETLVFGGGNAPANGMYKVDPAGEITALDEIPAAFIPFHGVATMILDVGFEDRLVVMRDGFEGGRGNPTPEIWWLLPNAPSGDQWQQSPDVITPALAEYTGVKRELAATAIRHLGVILVIRHWASGTLDADDPAGRRAAVWLYRPSN